LVVLPSAAAHTVPTKATTSIRVRMGILLARSPGEYGSSPRFARSSVPAHRPSSRRARRSTMTSS
jgi:hypothetical protein